MSCPTSPATRSVPAPASGCICQGLEEFILSIKPPHDRLKVFLQHLKPRRAMDRHGTLASDLSSHQTSHSPNGAQGAVDSAAVAGMRGPLVDEMLGDLKKMLPILLMRWQVVPYYSESHGAPEHPTVTKGGVRPVQTSTQYCKMICAQKRRMARPAPTSSDLPT